MSRLNALADKASGSEGFGLANYDNLQADIAYLIEAGADIASAGTIDITAEKHDLTGTTTVDNIDDTEGAVDGQQLRLLIRNGPITIRNNGGGAGNIRTVDGFDLALEQNETVVFEYDAADAVWRERAARPRIVRGTVSSAGGVVDGSGFTATRNSAGVYTVTFTNPLPAAPAVVVSPTDVKSMHRVYNRVAASFFVELTDGAGTDHDCGFEFVAVAL